MRDTATLSHQPFCDCFECLSPNSLLGVNSPYTKVSGDDHADAVMDNYVKSIQGKFVHSDKPVTIYTKVDGPVRRTADAGKFIGVVKDMSNGWITLDLGLGYIRFSNDLVFVAPDPNAKPLSASQLADVELNAISSIPGAGGLAGNLLQGVKTVGEKIASIDWLGDLKWIIIVVVAVLALILAINLTRK